MGITNHEVIKHMMVLYDWKTNGSTWTRFASGLLMGTPNEPKETQLIIAATHAQFSVHESNMMVKMSSEMPFDTVENPQIGQISERFWRLAILPTRYPGLNAIL